MSANPSCGTSSAEIKTQLSISAVSIPSSFLAVCSIYVILIGTWAYNAIDCMIRKSGTPLTW